MAMAVPLRTLAAVFLRLGATSFGGPAAHIALMEEEFVTRRGWLTRAELLDLIGAANLIPGPNSTEIAIHIGYRVAGWSGLLVAGVCFILPAVLIVMCLAALTVAIGQLPSVVGVFAGLKAVVVAVVAQALWKLGTTCLKTVPLVVLAVIATVLVAVGVHELLVLFGAGVLVASWRGRSPESPPPTLAFLGAGVPLGIVGSTVPFGLMPLFLFFLKVGSVLFGSGYVLLAFLRADLVERYGWLTEQQLLDAIAVGQVTPGPVFTTATYIGYLLGGPAGAVVATVGIFLPAFIFVALSVPLLERLRRSASAAGFLDGVNVASLALMAVVTAQLARAAVVDVFSALLLAVSVVLLLVFRVGVMWLLLGGAALGPGRVFIG